MSIITDYKFAKRKEKRDQTNDTINNLLNIAQFGKGIWDTVSEQNKYKPGSDYMNAQELGNKTWPMDVQNAKAKLDEAKAEGDQTRVLALQKYISDRTMELSKYEQPQMNYRAELAAGDQKTEKQSRMAAAIREAFGLAQTNPSWFLNDPSDPSGNSKIPNPATIDKLRENLLLAVGMYNPTKQDLAAVTPYLNSLLSSNGASPPPVTTDKGAVDFTPIWGKIASLAPRASVPKYDNKSFVRTWDKNEGALEKELNDLINSGRLQGEDLSAAQAALSKSSEPGSLGMGLYSLLYKVKEGLKSKYGMGAPVAPSRQGVQVNPITGKTRK